MKTIINIMKYIFHLILNLIFSNDPNRVIELTINGRYQFVWAREHVGRKIALRIFEKSETNFFLKNLKQGDICFDIGGNVGYFTHLFAMLVGHDGKVVSVEPVKRNCLLIQLASVLNKTDDFVKVVCTAVSDENKKMFVSSGSDSSYASISNESGEDESVVQSVTIDSLLKDLNIPRIDILKMDIEGYEYIALQGMKGILSDKQLRPRLMMIELYSSHLRKYGNNINDICTYLKKFDYNSFVLDSGLNLITFTPVHHDNTYNVFFVDGAKK